MQTKIKPIFIFLHGPSIEKIPIEDIRKLDAKFTSLNRFDILEDKLKIEFDIVWISSEQRFREVSIERVLEKDIWDHDYSLYAYGFSSLFAFICALIKEGYKEIYLFGCDGGAKTGDVYFSQDDMNEDVESRRNSIYKDTVIMNDLFWRLLEYWGIGNKNTVKIYNTNKDSLITCFDFISIDDLISSLG